MKLSELENGMIVLVDHNTLINDGRPIGAYVVMDIPNQGKVLVNFSGNCNNDERPSGWYEVEGAPFDELPYGTIGVYRAKFFGNIFRGDFDNEKYYECLYKA